MTDLPDLSAVDLLTLYRQRRASPVEVMTAVLARVEALEPRLAATWALDPDAALAEAAASEARWARGAPIGPLDGVPVTVKELIATKGVAKPLGSAATELTPEPADAPPAARLREAGAVIFCKTTSPDFGMLSSGLSSFHRLSRNPWDLSKTPGGSSAGAGGAAAAGYGPLHLGTDIGGSIRLPAGWCGVYGLKPSNGRVPIDPPYIGRVAGPMTRTVADSALMMSVLSAPDWRDHMSLPPASIAWMDLDTRRGGQAGIGRGADRAQVIDQHPRRRRAHGDGHLEGRGQQPARQLGLVGSLRRRPGLEADRQHGEGETPDGQGDRDHRRRDAQGHDGQGRGGHQAGAAQHRQARIALGQEGAGEVAEEAGDAEGQQRPARSRRRPAASPAPAPADIGEAREVAGDHQQHADQRHRHAGPARHLQQAAQLRRGGRRQPRQGQPPAPAAPAAPTTPAITNAARQPRVSLT
jgi:hypothetical protein